MTLISYRGPSALTHVKELDVASMTHKWDRKSQLTWFGKLLLGDRRRNG